MQGIGCKGLGENRDPANESSTRGQGLEVILPSSTRPLKVSSVGVTLLRIDSGGVAMADQVAVWETKCELYCQTVV